LGVSALQMIVCNGIIGICLLAGGLRHHEQGFQLRGANAALSVLIALTTLTLIFPNVTTTSAGPSFSRSQLSFAAIVSLILYGSFLFVQTVRHRDYFLPVDGDDEEAHALPPPNIVALVSGGLLLVSLVVVVALARHSPQLSSTRLKRLTRQRASLASSSPGWLFSLKAWPLIARQLPIVCRPA
jgi:Ca2+:H+ antiporter